MGAFGIPSSYEINLNEKIQDLEDKLGIDGRDTQEWKDWKNESGWPLAQALSMGNPVGMEKELEILESLLKKSTHADNPASATSDADTRSQKLKSSKVNYYGFISSTIDFLFQRTKEEKDENEGIFASIFRKINL